MIDEETHFYNFIIEHDLLKEIAIVSYDNVIESEKQYIVFFFAFSYQRLIKLKSSV